MTKKDRKLTTLLDTNGQYMVFNNYYLWLLIDLGFIITDHKAIAVFEKNRAYKPFVRTMMNLRIQVLIAGSSKEKSYKLIINASYGNDSLNTVKFDKIKSLVKADTFISQHHPNHIGTRCVSANTFAAQINLKTATCFTSLQSGVFTLHNAKYWYLNYVYNFIYKCLDRKRFHFVLADTDSIYIAIAGDKDKDCFQQFESIVTDKQFYDQHVYQYLPDPNKDIYDYKKKHGSGVQNEGYELTSLGPKCYSMIVHKWNNEKQQYEFKPKITSKGICKSQQISHNDQINPTLIKDKIVSDEQQTIDDGFQNQRQDKQIIIGEHVLITDTFVIEKEKEKRKEKNKENQQIENQKENKELLQIENPILTKDKQTIEQMNKKVNELEIKVRLLSIEKEQEKVKTLTETDQLKRRVDTKQAELDRQKTYINESQELVKQFQQQVVITQSEVTRLSTKVQHLTAELSKLRALTNLPKQQSKAEPQHQQIQQQIPIPSDTLQSDYLISLQQISFVQPDVIRGVQIQQSVIVPKPSPKEQSKPDLKLQQIQQSVPPSLNPNMLVGIIPDKKHAYQEGSKIIHTDKKGSSTVAFSTVISSGIARFQGYFKDHLNSNFMIGIADSSAVFGSNQYPWSGENEKKTVCYLSNGEISHISSRIPGNSRFELNKSISLYTSNSQFIITQFENVETSSAKGGIKGQRIVEWGKV
ncbi:MAG: hypothetical protein EZS28_000648 [Streblomastix strix]|uniref:Uncharacterized protein n=1 Tax=Streblomastix strix TaxID=222440 RepID=A0A5J4X9S0_9EUKA|nr:MAG: hypothetical protein EZS28_000648 [Streblomastix strix]